MLFLLAKAQQLIFMPDIPPMKQFYLVTVLFLSQLLNAQQQNFSIHHIKLPPALAEPENQFSGLQVADEKLFLLPECRIQQGHTARVYTINLSDIEKQLKDSSYSLPFEEIQITGLQAIMELIEKNGQKFEGLEAFIVSGKTAYFSVETPTASPDCYLLKGKITEGSIKLNGRITAIKKPAKKDGTGIYNAGFEAIALRKNKLLAFYEYNYFDKSFVYSLKKSLSKTKRGSLVFDNLPFRITDITPSGYNHYTAINYFYKGDGEDTVYRVQSTDNTNYSLIHSEGKFTDYCRLVNIEYRHKKFEWKTLWEFPKNYFGYNWEGIAAYNNGYFITNDKYTANKPYSSILLYLQKKN